MKKVKIFIIATVFIIIGFIMGACANTVIADQTYPLKIWKEKKVT